MKVVIDGVEYVPKQEKHQEEIKPAPRPQRKMLAIKSPLPVKAGTLDWHTRYFNEGDPITWLDRRTGKVVTGAVTKVKRNQFGRISYVTDIDKLVLTEEIQDAL